LRRRWPRGRQTLSGFAASRYSLPPRPPDTTIRRGGRKRTRPPSARA
jgi:hypothetical protein